MGGALALGFGLALRYGLGAGWLLAALGAINVVTFALYLYDKSVAGGAQTRVPEAILHLFTLLGGSPAAFAAQQILRHKTRKRPFQITFWCIVAAQAAALALYFWR